MVSHTFHVPGIGHVVGKQKETRERKRINVFRGVPYAKPPIGGLRFRLPEPFEYSSKNLWNFAKKESTKCKQLHPLFPNSRIANWAWNLKASEDCLYLNVYTPCFPNNVSAKYSTQANLPVIVWFHGGAFCVESNNMSQYGPDFLLDQDVVLVGVNYRLGPLGFFNLDCDEAPG